MTLVWNLALRSVLSWYWNMSKGITLPDDTKIRATEESEGCKYLGVLELDEILQDQMREKIGKEYPNKRCQMWQFLKMEEWKRRKMEKLKSTKILHKKNVGCEGKGCSSGSYREHWDQYQWDSTTWEQLRWTFLLNWSRDVHCWGLQRFLGRWRGCREETKQRMYRSFPRQLVVAQSQQTNQLQYHQ